MLPMRFPILGILGGKGLIADEQEVFRVFLLSRFGEVKASSDDGFAVNDDDFAMGNGVFRIDHGRHPLIRQEIGRRVLLRVLALV
jgi:hypothetical protein